jgi:hypothetical protein
MLPQKQLNTTCQFWNSSSLISTLLIKGSIIILLLISYSHSSTSYTGTPVADVMNSVTLVPEETPSYRRAEGVVILSKLTSHPKISPTLGKSRRRPPYVPLNT